ncbi:HEAT repeat domain-containing protein [Paenibacillus sp. HJL G12]|uniref:HEAT repeat domain-containing protein n=1 Tax=Paenibacillus dendrobii TaxID=2691084 RepID=A0A7X3IEK3_9BACL|nr:HEAT repeat domain-containing protein [Paenibacillus dendrobii]MWV42133.1 HEAT repeat domain-containing protein [Paenibacillus dendrobii]
MSQTLLMELNEEVRRLYIAGSDLAAGDYRLKRLLPSFQQLGERAPVFKKLGEGVQALIETDQGSATDSARKLQDVNLLLHSVLHTLGKGSAEGETVPLKSTPLPLPTRLSYRKLSAVRTALTTRGSGRHEVILEAFREGIFRDLRLFPLAVEALNDPYVDIAEFAMTDILPSYGPAIVPHLLESFQPAGGKLESRKLNVIAKSGGQGVFGVVFEAALSGSDEVRITAIRLLAGHPEYEQALLDFSRDKKKGIREAAYHALADSGWESAAERLYEAFKGKDGEIVNSSLSRCASPLLTGWLTGDFAELLHSLPEVIENKPKTEEIWTQVKRYLWALNQKENPELEKLYLNVLRNYKLYMFKLGWTFLANEAMQYMKKTESEEGWSLMVGAVEMDLKKYAGTSSYAREIFIKAQPLLSPERLYEEYAKILSDRKHASAVSRSANYCKQLLDTMEEMVVLRRYQAYKQVWTYEEKTGYTYHVEMLPQHEIIANWDHRWLDHVLELDHLALVGAFARPGHAEAVSYLLGKLRNSPEFRNRFANLAVMGLVRAGVAGNQLHEALVRALEDERNTECHEIEPFLFEQLCCLPASYAERIRAVLPKFKSSAEEQLEYILKNMESSIQS